MPRSHPAYPPEYRAETVRLVREGGGSPEHLARDLGCSAQTIRNRVRQADFGNGCRAGGLTTTEREELRRLRRDVKVLQQERGP